MTSYRGTSRTKVRRSVLLAALFVVFVLLGTPLALFEVIG